MTPPFALKKSSDSQQIVLRPTMSVGKLDTSDIVLREGLPSRHHAKLDLERDELHVEDLQSRNGTFVNGLQISARTRLYGGDTVRFDVEEFAVIGPPRPDIAAQDQATICRPPPAAAPAAGPSPTPKPAASTPSAATPPATPPAAPAPASAPATPAGPAGAATPPSALAPEAAAAAPSPAKRDASPKAAERRPPAWLEPGDASGKTKFVKRTAGGAGRRDPGSDGNTDVMGAPVAPESVQIPTLLIISGTSAGRRFPLENNGESQQEWTIGSDASNSIPLPDPEISATHAVIRREAKQWKIIDKFSTNGTFVNKQSTVTRVLAAGDRLQFGPVETQLLLPAAGLFDSNPWSGTDGSQAAGSVSKSRILWLTVSGFVLMLIAIGVAVKFFLKSP